MTPELTDQMMFEALMAQSAEIQYTPAYESAMDNAQLSVREGACKQYDADWYAYFMSAYACALNDIAVPCLDQ